MVRILHNPDNVQQLLFCETTGVVKKVDGDSILVHYTNSFVATVLLSLRNPFPFDFSFD